MKRPNEEEIEEDIELAVPATVNILFSDYFKRRKSQKQYRKNRMERLISVLY
jgi:hypothetical protein